MLVVHHAFIFLKYLMGARGLCHVCRDLQLEWPLLPLFPSTLTELDTDRRHTHSQLCAVSMQSNDNSNDDKACFTHFGILLFANNFFSFRSFLTKFKTWGFLQQRLHNLFSKIKSDWNKGYLSGKLIFLFWFWM